MLVVKEINASQSSSLILTPIPSAEGHPYSFASDHTNTMTASKADPILLSLFAARFMSVAEAMGRSLQRTSISTNIKERLDFSCAIFSPDGSLVANAPHLPVHLGSMSFAVRYQIDRLMHGKDGGDKDKDKGIKQGDVILANHPSAGGSHLPDMTCITPVFDEAGKEIIFFTASRGHHAGTSVSYDAQSACAELCLQTLEASFPEVCRPLQRIYTRKELRSNRSRLSKRAYTIERAFSTICVKSQPSILGVVGHAA
jgi:hypothetical protein